MLFCVGSTEIQADVSREFIGRADSYGHFMKRRPAALRAGSSSEPLSENAGDLAAHLLESLIEARDSVLCGDPAAVESQKAPSWFLVPLQKELRYRNGQLV